MQGELHSATPRAISTLAFASYSCYYSAASHSGPSVKRTVSLQWTNLVERIATYIGLV